MAASVTSSNSLASTSVPVEGAKRNSKVVEFMERNQIQKLSGVFRGFIHLTAGKDGLQDKEIYALIQDPNDATGLPRMEGLVYILLFKGQFISKNKRADFKNFERYVQELTELAPENVYPVLKEVKKRGKGRNQAFDQYLTAKLKTLSPSRYQSKGPDLTEQSDDATPRSETCPIFRSYVTRIVGGAALAALCGLVQYIRQMDRHQQIQLIASCQGVFNDTSFLLSSRR